MKYFLQHYTINGQQIKTYSAEEGRTTVPEGRTQIEVPKEVWDRDCAAYRAENGKYTKFDITDGDIIGTISKGDFITGEV